jgi:hypothetical protein
MAVCRSPRTEKYPSSNVARRAPKVSWNETDAVFWKMERQYSRSRSAYLAEKASTFRAAFCSHQFQLAELSGTLVWRVVTPMYPSGRILQRRGSAKGHSGVSRRLERKSQAFCLDGYGGIDYGKAVSLSANVGEDSTRMHFATQQKEWH